VPRRQLHDRHRHRRGKASITGSRPAAKLPVRRENLSTSHESQCNAFSFDGRLQTKKKNSWKNKNTEVIVITSTNAQIHVKSVSKNRMGEHYTAVCSALGGMLYRRNNAFGFQGGEEPATVLRKKGYQKDAQQRWTFLQPTICRQSRTRPNCAPWSRDGQAARRLRPPAMFKPGWKASRSDQV
jgi:hypothetical protein